MKLKTKYKTQDEIPEAFRELYTESGGQYVLTGIEGVRTDEDVTTLRTSLDAERQAHRATKAELRQWADLGIDFEKATERLDKYEELEAAAAGKIDDAKIQEIVERRVKAQIAPKDRELATATRKAQEAEAQVGELKGQINKGRIESAVRKAAEGAKLLPEAIDDALMMANSVFEVTEEGKVLVKDNSGFTPGLEPSLWLTDLQPKRPHWWPASQGGGAKGGGRDGNGFVNNPFTKANWNLTEQGRIVKEKGLEQASKMAQAAGTSVGGPPPAA